MTFFIHSAIVHSVEITEFYCHGFSQKFRQINVLLLKNITVNWFDEKKLQKGFSQKFRQINVLPKSYLL